MGGSLEAPLANAAEPEMELTAGDPAGHTQRTMTKLYEKGDVVDIWSSQRDAWMPDGEVVDIMKDTAVISGARVRVGSMKVVFNNGKSYAWISPQQKDKLRRPSVRPKFIYPAYGQLSMKEGDDWKPAYAEIARGYLTWWNDQFEAEKGEIAQGFAYLKGLRVESDKKSFALRSDNTEGTLHSFAADSEPDAKAWVEFLHANAEYCDMVADLKAQQEHLEKLNAA